MAAIAGLIQIKIQLLSEIITKFKIKIKILIEMKKKTCIIELQISTILIFFRFCIIHLHNFLYIVVELYLFFSSNV
mgnify:CR=1 FL=1